MMRRLFYSIATLVITLSLAGLAAAQGAKSTTLTGNIVDKQCSAGMAKKDNPQEAAAGHKKGCALSDGCAKSGFGVYADGKFHEFDAKGNELAKAALEKSAKDKGASFKVVGVMADGKLTVQSITEVQ